MIRRELQPHIAPALLDWWQAHGRKDLPWQSNPTPYRVWVSEIMLQQTQVTTVARYYDRFMASFADVSVLAEASQDRVLHLWSGLGYYARARNLHSAAGIVRDRFHGKMPTDFDSLMSLPGIGRSTAGAILALATNQSFPILDGNARRVLARTFGIQGWPGVSAVSSELWRIAEDCTPVEKPARYTQAIMDLGASVCTRRNPECTICPLQQVCVASQENTVHEIPAARPKRHRPSRAVVLAVVVRKDGAVLLEKRPPSGVWGGLWAFPEMDSLDAVDGWCQHKVGFPPTKIVVHEDVSHGFTHFKLNMTPVEIRVEQSAARMSDETLDGDRWLWYNLHRPTQIGLAAPVSRLLHTFGEFK